MWVCTLPEAHRVSNISRWEAAVIDSDCAWHLMKDNGSTGWGSGSAPVLRGMPRAGSCWCARLLLAKIAKFRKFESTTFPEKNTRKFPPPFRGLCSTFIVEKLRLGKTRPTLREIESRGFVVFQVVKEQSLPTESPHPGNGVLRYLRYSKGLFILHSYLHIWPYC